MDESLSDKRKVVVGDDDEFIEYDYPEEDVKEFIKDVENDFKEHRNIAQHKHPESKVIIALCNEFIEIIKKRAGKGLA